jgi:glycosyltransferase involved in cell wall biosynthesis
MNAPVSAHSLSVVVPVYNEVENAAPLCDEIARALSNLPYPWEAIIVDDGSRDNTVRALKEAAARHGPHFRIVELQRNFGQTAAMQAGIDAARGTLIATLDGDLQNDPADIPMMVTRLIDEDLDLVAGWRKNRQDKLILRKIPSRIANRLIGRVTGVKLNDYGCSLKVYRARLLKQVVLYGEMHRFIPVWLATVTSPARMQEQVVNHRARTAGVSKYGISRTTRVLLDLLAAFFFLRYRHRPGHFFGSLGLIVGALGGGILTYLAVLKIFLGESIGERPLLMLGILLSVGAVQLLTTGVLAEILARIYYGNGNRKSYILREEVISLPQEQGWAPPKP